MNDFMEAPRSGEETIDGRSVKARGTFEKYQDPSQDLDSQTLKYGLWYVSHRLVLYRAVVIGLIVLSLGFFGYAGAVAWREINVALNDQGKFEARLRNFTDFTAVNARLAAQNLQVLSASVLPGGVDKYDLVAEVKNPNPRFLVRFDYSFLVNGQTTPPQRGFLLPGEERLVAMLGVKTATYPNAPEIVLTNVAWKRISSREVANLPNWLSERTNFSVTDVVFKDAGSETLSAALSFTVTNNSPYGYVAPQFYVGLYNQSSLVGVLPLTLNNFTSLSAKKVQLYSLAPNLYVSDVKLMPLIDLFDKEVYLDPEK